MSELAPERVEELVAALDRGELRVAERVDGEWRVNEEAQRAINAYFRLRGMEPCEVGPFEYHDKIPLKRGYADLGVRVVPPGVARYGAYLSPGTFFGPSGDGYWRLALVPTVEECRRAAAIFDAVL